MGALTDHIRTSAKSPPLSSHSSSNKGSKSRSRLVSQRLDQEEWRNYTRSLLNTPNQISWSQKKKPRLGSPPSARSHQSLLLPRSEPAASAANLPGPQRQISPVTVIRTLELFPTPSPLRRPVQGPQRPQQQSRMLSAPKQLGERVLEAQHLEDKSRVWSKLEDQCNPKPSFFEESYNREALEEGAQHLEGESRVWSKLEDQWNRKPSSFEESYNRKALEEEGQHLEDESRVWSKLEDQWNRKPGFFEESSNRKALEDYKRRLALLQRKIDNTERNNNGGNGVFTRLRGLQITPSSSSSASTITTLVDAERGTEARLGHDRVAKPGDDSEAKAGNSQPQYQKLFEKAKGKDFTLERIDLELKLTTAKLAALQFTRKELFKNKEKEAEVTEEKPQALEEAFAPLNDDDEADVSRALKGRNRREVLVMHKHSNIEITREILQCLLPSGWLNDEVINLYLELLKEREKREPNKFLKCHFFNTFFYKKLYNPKTSYDYKAVKRWTTQRKIGYSLIDCEKIFVPIHKEIHWCLAIIDMKAKKFQYLDSLKGSDANVLDVLARYITDEAKDKTGQDLDVSSWEIELVEDLPQQENGSDCGMFMIKYADFHSRGLPLSFYQTHMPYFRKRTAKEILRLKAE